MSSLRRGLLYGFAAYALWGLFPLYFKLLRPSAPIEILAHRVLWSAVFVALILLAIRGWRTIRRLARAPWLLAGLATASVLIAVNWGMFIHGVDTDRVVEVSLGYFINPLVTVLLGVFVLRERLRRWQWVALGIGAVAVTILTVDYGRLPYIALALAASFGLYGLIKKTLGLPAVQGLFVETALLALPAVAFLWWLAGQGRTTVATVSLGHTVLVLGAGVLTAVPLLLFAGAANRIPLTSLGILQYLAPMLHFMLGVFLFHEPMPPARLAGFALVWLALTVFTMDALRQARTRTAVPAQLQSNSPSQSQSSSPSSFEDQPGLPPTVADPVRP